MSGYVKVSRQLNLNKNIPMKNKLKDLCPTLHISYIDQFRACYWLARMNVACNLSTSLGEILYEVTFNSTIQCRIQSDVSTAHVSESFRGTDTNGTPPGVSENTLVLHHNYLFLK